MKGLTAKRPYRDAVTSLGGKSDISLRADHGIMRTTQHDRHCIPFCGKGMDGGKRMVEPSIQKPEPDNERRPDSRQAFLEVRVVLPSQMKMRNVRQKRLRRIHVTNHQLGPAAVFRQRVNTAIRGNHRPCLGQ